MCAARDRKDRSVVARESCDFVTCLTKRLFFYIASKVRIEKEEETRMKRYDAWRFLQLTVSGDSHFTSTRDLEEH